MTRKSTNFLGSLEKGLSVIEAFSAERARLSIAEVAALTGLDRATSRRCLLTLSELDYADYDGKYFRLTPRILRLGTACLATMPLPNMVQPLLDAHPDPDEDHVRHYLTGNLCRCSTYPEIMDAVKLAVAKRKAIA